LAVARDAVVRAGTPEGARPGPSTWMGRRLPGGRPDPRGTHRPARRPQVSTNGRTVGGARRRPREVGTPRPAWHADRSGRGALRLPRRFRRHPLGGRTARGEEARGRPLGGPHHRGAGCRSNPALAKGLSAFRRKTPGHRRRTNPSPTATTRGSATSRWSGAHEGLGPPAGGAGSGGRHLDWEFVTWGDPDGGTVALWWRVAAMAAPHHAVRRPALRLRRTSPRPLCRSSGAGGHPGRLRFYDGATPVGGWKMSAIHAERASRGVSRDQAGNGGDLRMGDLRPSDPLPSGALLGVVSREGGFFFSTTTGRKSSVSA